MSKQRLHVCIEGMVQGVNFRHGTMSQARALGLGGWVRNLPDGRVEAEFEGDPKALDQMLEWCQQGPPAARVERVESTRHDDTAGYSTFSIR